MQIERIISQQSSQKRSGRYSGEITIFQCFEYRLSDARFQRGLIQTDTARLAGAAQRLAKSHPQECMLKEEIVNLLLKPP